MALAESSQHTVLVDYDGSVAARERLESAARQANERRVTLEVVPSISRRLEWLLGFGEGLAGFVPMDRGEVLRGLGEEADRKLHQIAGDMTLSWRVSVPERNPP